MKLQIKELGAIKEGTIDLSKKLNVFCGPNGTGKTYMAYTIYGLLKNQIHIGSNEELVKNLIDNKNIHHIIDFDALHEYRKDLVSNFKDDFDSLFGIGEELAKQFFGNTCIEFKESDEEFENTLTQCAFESLLSIRKTNIKFIKQSNSKELQIELLDKTISNEDIRTLNVFLNSAIFVSYLSY